MDVIAKKTFLTIFLVCMTGLHLTFAHMLTFGFSKMENVLLTTNLFTSEIRK